MTCDRKPINRDDVIVYFSHSQKKVQNVPQLRCRKHLYWCGLKYANHLKEATQAVAACVRHEHAYGYTNTHTLRTAGLLEEDKVE
jgi:hypothetical protein